MGQVGKVRLQIKRDKADAKAQGAVGSIYATTASMMPSALSIESPAGEI